MKKQLRFHQWALLYFAFFVGLLFFVLGPYLTFMGWQSQSWLKVPGAIHWVGPYGWGYSYTVDGTTYRGTRADYKGTSGRHIDQARRRKLYPEGRPVDVYYWPAHPSFSVLNPGLGENNWLFYFGGGIFMLVFGGQIWYFRSRSRS